MPLVKNTEVSTDKRHRFPSE